MNWQQAINNPFLHDLPFKIELNKFGQVLMSPASNLHGIIQIEISHEIKRRLRRGTVLAECAIKTSDGVKVADVAWASDEFMREYGKETPFKKAPEICVEIISPGNSKKEIEFKTELYLAQGALEVWIITDKRKLSFHCPDGAINESRLTPNIKYP
ncbi:MAG: Uma2 family endonuclease [Candidatus Sumerlaeota bacterium]|nr:Uma2 family endonuclease [Candidatus Sumerlaeota bacterium]